MPKFKVHCTEKRHYTVEITAPNLMQALYKANRPWYKCLRTEDVSQRQFTPLTAEFINPGEDNE